MSIRFTCGSCGKRLSAPDTGAGTQNKCPSCGELLNIPVQSGALAGEHADSVDDWHQIDDRLCFRGSRWARLFGGRLTELLSPLTFTLCRDCIETKRVGTCLLPWTSEVELIPFREVAEYTIRKGLIWDMVRVRTFGGSKDLCIHGLRKADAEQLTIVLEGRLTHFHI